MSAPNFDAVQRRFEFVKANFHQLCRFCCMETSNLSPVLEDPGGPAETIEGLAWRYNQERNIGSLLEKGYVRFQPEEEIDMPNFICEKCVDSLVLWNRFHETFSTGTRLLLKVRDQLEESIDAKTIPSDADFKEIAEISNDKVVLIDNDAYEIEYVQMLPENALLDEVTIVETLEDEYDRDSEEILIEELKEESDHSEFNGFDDMDEETIEPVSPEQIQQSETSTELKEIVKKKVNIRHKTPQQCPVCGVIVKAKMKHHLMRHKDPTGHPFKCSQCRKSYSFKRTLDDHIRQVHQNIRYSCEVCQKEFVSRDVLRVHSKLHANEEHRCQICDQTFQTRVYLKKHMVVHEQKRFTCNDCAKTFRFNEQLKQHARIHTGEKPFPCWVCTKSFRTSAHRKQHQRTHTQAKVFKCKQCPVAYANKKSLERHVALGQHQQQQ